jgi:threonine dehydrogenase-like Zn-dependent dehydrogenase
MRAVVKADPTAPGVVVEERPEPSISGPGDVLVAVAVSGISGSEVNIWRGTYRRPNGSPVEPGRVLGYEHAGRVVDAGAAARKRGFDPGSQVVLASPFIGCGRCRPCAAGLINRCRAWGHIGITTNGTNANVSLLPFEVLALVPDGVDALDGAFLNTAALAVRATDRAGLLPGHTVAIVGPGPVGLYLLQAARAAGASWTAVVGRETDGSRLAIASSLGADATFQDVDALEAIRSQTGGGVDIVLEASGTSDGVRLAVDLAGVGAVVALTGLPPSRTADFEAIRVTRDEITITGVEGNLAPDRERALALIAAGQLRAGPLVTHRFPLEEAEDAFALVDRGTACKAVFTIS